MNTVGISVTSAMTMEMPINGETPVGLGDSLGPLDIAEGEYRIRITAAGDATAVVFDSGAVTLAGGTDPIIAAVDNTNAGSESPVSALVVSRLDVVTEIQDTQTTAELRVTHAVPDVGAPVDVWINGDPAIEGFNFPETVGPIALPGGDYVFQVAVGGMPVINPDEDTTTLANGVYYDAIATGSVAAENLGLAAYADDRRRLATAAKLRLAHLSPSTPDVDIYLVDETVNDISAIDATFTDGFNSGYLQVTPGTYNVYITVAGSKDIAIAAEGIALDAAGLYSAFARDADTANAETGPGLILLDDFVSP